MAAVPLYHIMVRKHVLEVLAAVSIMQRTLTFYNTIPRNQWVHAVTGKIITRGPVTSPASEYLQVYNVLVAAFTPCKCNLLHRHYSLNSDVCNIILARVSLMFYTLELVYPFQSNTSQPFSILFFLS